jgi:hypothetical protein
MIFLFFPFSLLRQRIWLNNGSGARPCLRWEVRDFNNITSFVLLLCSGPRCPLTSVSWSFTMLWFLFHIPAEGLYMELQVPTEDRRSYHQWLLRDGSPSDNIWRFSEISKSRSCCVFYVERLSPCILIMTCTTMYIHTKPSVPFRRDF